MTRQVTTWGHLAEESWPIHKETQKEIGGKLVWHKVWWPHFSCSFASYVLSEQAHLLSEEFEYNHGSFNITQTDKAALIL